jgi:hypothetical protein
MVKTYLHLLRRGGLSFPSTVEAGRNEELKGFYIIYVYASSLVHTCPHTPYDYAINVWLVRSEPWQEKIKSRRDLTSRNRRNDLMHNAPSET